MTTLTGLNWGHRRALAPMEAAAKLARERLCIDVHWEVQSLAGFEHGLDGAIANRFDLVVFDHPFCGEIAAGGWMRPLDDLLPALHGGDFAGASLASYRYAGRLWALPVDAATQVSVYRPDLIEPDMLPRRWEEVIDLGRRLRASGRYIGLPTLAPHGVLALLGLCANMGRPIALDPWADPFDRDTLVEAAMLLKTVADLTHTRCRAMNAIDLHDAMSSADEIAYCPIAYGYTTYAERDLRHPLRFAGLPGPCGDAGGSVLGGTGLGITRGCRDIEAATAFATLLASADVQCATFMRHHGQPGRVEGWRGAPEDQAFGGAHATLHDPIAAAWTRPRFPGYIAWQSEGGKLVERFIAGEFGAAQLVDALESAWLRHAPALPGVQDPPAQVQNCPR